MNTLQTIGRGFVGGIVVAYLVLPASVLAAGPSPTQFPDYRTAHTVIKCPYLPAGMTPPTCHGLQATCVGTKGDDLILGTEGPDVIVALAGNDVVHGDQGNDTVCGGPGNDSLFGARDSDTLLGEAGDDWLFGAPGDDDLRGGPGYDVLWGGPGADKLSGGEGKHDVCMLQREMGIADDSCETIYPPPGYVHDQEPEAGVLKIGKPK
jgi:Ca2+-binding RTX toxin-like protein